MKRISFLTLVILIMCFAVSAQYHTNANKNWTFGYSSGLDFNSGSPIPFTSQISSTEAGASVSDNSGNLLFYSDGHSVYNRLHERMPGSPAVGFATTSTTQGAVIVPVLTNTNRYYLFSIEEQESPGSKGRIAYTVVDMTLNGGLGDLVPAEKGIIFDSGLSERMATVSGNACNIWLLTHSKYTPNPKFFAYRITPTGISAPTVSVVGSLSDSITMGCMKIAHDGTKIVTTSPIGAQFYDFNPSTGVVSNCRVLDSNFTYGVEFSADNSKLYLTYASGYIYQFDISLPTLAAIKASKTVVSIPASGTAGYRQIKIAPDNKIYVPSLTISPYVNKVDCISSPNLSGTACGFVSGVVDLGPNWIRMGMPNVFVSTNMAISGATFVCVGGTTTLSSGISGGTWSSSNPSVATVGIVDGVVTGLSSGSTTISYTTGGCTMATLINVVTSPAALGGLATACVGYHTTLFTSTPGGAWVSASPGIATVTSGIVTGVSAGTTVISYSLPGSCAPVTTTISIIPSLPPITGTAIICQYETTPMSNSVAGGRWTSDYSLPAIVHLNYTTGSMLGFSPGTTNITYSMGGCTSTAVVTVNPAPMVTATTTSICVGDSIEMTVIPTGGTWSTSNAAVANMGTPSHFIKGISAGTAKITYTLGTGCFSTVLVTVVPVSACIPSSVTNSVDPIDAPVVYPNPTSGVFTIFHSGNEPFSIIVTNVIGKQVKTISVSDRQPVTIDLTGASGLHFVSINYSNYRRIHKLVIQ